MTKLALGLMSGTSADGLTVCAITPSPFKIICFKNYKYPSQLQQKLLSAYRLRADRLSQLNYELGALYAKTVRTFLKDFHLSPKDIYVIGSHGQTVYHGPKDAIANTLQIGEPSFLAAQLGVPVVSDFRAKDVALGGQGAPLMPFFDAYIWGKGRAKILLNIGGISNFSVVGKGTPSLGFDAGPGNTLMDLFCQMHLHKPFDKNGALAAKGTPDKKLVARLLTQKYFSQKPPKSLDKNDFGKNYLAKYFLNPPAKNSYDVLATLTWFTAAAIAQQITKFVAAKDQREIVLSGGGSYNKTLVRFLQELLPHIQLKTSQDYHIDPQAKESAAFALFAWLALHKKINHPARATGAQKPSVLGKISL